SRVASVASSVHATTIRAHVIDVDGGAIAGARVGVLTVNRPLEGDDYYYVTSPQVEFVAGTTATTDAAGACDVAIERLDANSIVDVVATADGFNAGLWPRARLGDDVFFTLARANELSGTVRDLSGAPIAGALIRWVAAGPRRFEGAVRSGADGRFRFASYPGAWLRLGGGDSDAHETTWISVVADGF